MENNKLGKLTKKPLLQPIILEVVSLIEEAILLSKDSSYVFTNKGSDEVMGKGATLALPYGIM